MNVQKLQKNVCVNKLFWSKHSSYTLHLVFISKVNFETLTQFFSEALKKGFSPGS